jgi:hypothetical protein
MRTRFLLGLFPSLTLVACGSGSTGTTGSTSRTTGGAQPHDPVTASVVQVDRFSAQAGTLMVRTASNGLPAANAPIDYDQAPFITQGFGPTGQVVQYYNFDVRPATAAPIYVFFESGATAPVRNQLNVIDRLPGDTGYNDFWQVMRVTVPADYVANTIASLSEIQAAAYSISPTNMIVNCPVVPAGSTASKRSGGGSTALTQGWYRDQIVNYFTFDEAMLTASSGASVPVSAIYVTFNVNPNKPNGGPASGFMTETGSMQTHNVVQTIPGQAGYSPLWGVRIYDDTDFSSVMNLKTAEAATNLAAGPLVNCPIVSIR